MLDFHKKMSVKSSVIAKKSLQKILTDLRKMQDITVEKIGCGYQAFLTTPKGNKFLVLKAMNGNSGYLTRYDKNLFE